MHQLLPLRWRQQGPNPQHRLQALFAGGKLQSANGVGLLHDSSCVRHLLGEQRTHLGLCLAQLCPESLLLRPRCINNRAYRPQGLLVEAQSLRILGDESV